VECENHKKAVRSETSFAKVTPPPGSKSNDAVLAAEGAFAFHTMKRHTSYKTAHCTSLLFKTIFPDNEIAHKFSRVHMKTEAVINSVIAYRDIENIMQVFKTTVLMRSCLRHKQSECCEGVSVVNQYFDWKNGDLPSKLTEVLQQPNEAAETVAQYIKGTLENHVVFNL
jgi:hypothetical protein